MQGLYSGVYVGQLVNPAYYKADNEITIKYSRVGMENKKTFLQRLKVA